MIPSAYAAPTMALVALLVLAGGAFVLRGIMQRRRNAPLFIGAKDAGTMMALADAAAAAYQAAKRESMTINTVAEKAGDAVEWFKQSIAGVVSVYSCGDDRAFVRVDGHGFAAMDSQAQQKLHIRKADLPAYLRWARSVQ